jgi:hypothetical protein
METGLGLQFKRGNVGDSVLEVVVASNPKIKDL